MDFIEETFAKTIAQYSGQERKEATLWFNQRREAFDKASWFHGGYPNMQVGDTILPASVTGTIALQTMLLDLKPHGLNIRSYADIIDPTYSPDFVYLTHSRAMAADHAAAWSAWHYIKTGQWQSGRLYRVSPMGILVPYFANLINEICCCMVHDASQPCCVKTSAGIVDLVICDVEPVLNGHWRSLYDELRGYYPLWNKAFNKDYERSSNPSAQSAVS